MASSTARRLRCAIYTRKSTEEGLEQAFNSLDAQREACAAYILSQKHEGWTIHASQANYLQDSYLLPTWLVYVLWDREFYTVRDLQADPLG